MIYMDGGYIFIRRGTRSNEGVPPCLGYVFLDNAIWR